MTNSPHWPRAFQDSVHLIIAHFDKIWLPTICSPNFCPENNANSATSNNTTVTATEGRPDPQKSLTDFFCCCWNFFRRRSLSNIRARDHNSLARIKSRLVLVKKMRGEHAFEEMKVWIRKGENPRSGWNLPSEASGSLSLQGNREETKNFKNWSWSPVLCH